MQEAWLVWLPMPPAAPHDFSLRSDHAGLVPSRFHLKQSNASLQADAHVERLLAQIQNLAIKSDWLLHLLNTGNVPPIAITAMDAVIAAGLLPRILSKLESPWDLARVPSVCRNWQSARSEATPTRLTIAGQDIGDGEGEGVHLQMRQ